MFDEALLRQLWPHGDSKVAGLIAGTAATAPAVFAKYGISSDLVVAHAMAQFSEESGHGTEMVENMNYSAARLLEVFGPGHGNHFTTAQAIAMQHNPKAIADQAYGGRMGNRPPPSDDGWNFRGQGFSQLTGRDNYVALSRTTKLDLVNHPEFLRDPQYALDCAIGDFIQCGCLPWAGKDDLVAVSSLLNVGHLTRDTHKINGFAMRQHELAIWKHAMGVS